MLHVLSGIGVLSAAAMIGASATMNFLFMHSLGRTELEGYVLGVVSVAVDLLKALLAIFVAVAARKGFRIYVLIAGGAFVLFSLASILSAIGFAVQNRAGVAESAAVKANNLADAESEYKRLVDRLRAIAISRPSAAIEAEIKNRQLDQRWRATRRCAVASGQDHLAFCRGLSQLDGELASAHELTALEAKVAEQRARIAALRSDAKTASGDYQAGVLARILGLEPGTLRVVLAAFVALIVEVASGLGLYLATGHMRPAATIDKVAGPSTVSTSPAPPSNESAPSPQPTIAVRARAPFSTASPTANPPRTARSPRVARRSDSETGAGE